MDKVLCAVADIAADLQCPAWGNTSFAMNKVFNMTEWRERRIFLDPVFQVVAIEEKSVDIILSFVCWAVMQDAAVKFLKPFVVAHNAPDLRPR